ncbi:MAG TPA: 50S ribosomal protein L11 methyltransferase [Pyrinomonadaceae bacterium]|jgi:ribosomal protein L11 methyltransferase|nr:50S ribosomal protein L11 methyltransferase [Pyrinomonadaceae bacterium]
MSRWFAVDVTVRAEAADAVASALDALGSIGSSTDIFKTDPVEPVVVTGFFEEAVSQEDVGVVLAPELEINGFDRDAVLKIGFRTVENQDWLLEWKKHWRPTEVGKFVIAPPWSEIADTDKIVIRIEPNMAFGTGTHETTRLCLEVIGDVVQPQMTVLDVGTGTGVLAIAAAKLGCMEIVACDTDPDSIKIARENAEANGVGGAITCFEGSIDDRTAAADLVIANLTVDVITPLLPALFTRAKRLLLLSGILADQEPQIREHLSEFDISNLRIQMSGEWISVLVSPKASRAS